MLAQLTPFDFEVLKYGNVDCIKYIFTGSPNSKKVILALVGADIVGGGAICPLQSS